MKDSTRRNFLRKSTLVGLGTAAATSGFALGETEAETILRGVDAELAGVLRSYGRTRAMAESGSQMVVVGSKSCRLQAFRVGVEVRNPKSFCRSRDAVGRLSDLVMAEGNTLRFAREGRFFVIENRVV